ncbi:YncE family protein [Gemmatimonas sp.]|uniref:YncE family protein n=1 Tax=Gemmatimonas sp. TaxID=1962908 RepID=UPI0037C0942A
MHSLLSTPRPRLRAGLGALVAAVALGACSGDEVIDPPFADTVKPRVTIAKGNAVADTLLSVTINATDNIGLKRVRLLLSGGLTATYDTTMISAVTSLTLAVNVKVPSNAPIGATVNARSVAIDGAGNLSDTALVALTVGNLEPPRAIITSPVAASPVVSGKALVLSLSGKARYKVRTLGYQISGAFNAADSLTFTSPLRDSLAILDTLTIPDSVRGATINVTPFITDSLNQRVLGSSVAYAVQSPANANTIPVVRTGVSRRVEVSDTVFVEATDPVGISVIGYEVRTLTGQIVVADSVTTTGAFSTLVRTFRTRVPVNVFPTAVTVAGFARNANGRRDVSRLGSGAVRADTVQVVAGYTNPLPGGGQVADALYVPRTDRLYLSNIERNWLEVFNLADSTFRAPVSVGSRPWGIAAWPRNRDGAVGDTLLVANSGGTNISYVDLNAGPTGREVYRYPLPNIMVYSITSVKSQLTDQVITQRTVYDFSDRPQYLAATCVAAPNPGTPCGDVLAVYSTTPTPGQSTPFPNTGTVRWENLNKNSSHFFFEQAMGQTQNRSDTLEIERFAAAGVGADSVLLPGRQTIVTPGGSFTYSVVARLDQLAFRDTTFVRNSGNFRRVVIGEGGPVLGSRALTYDVTRGFDTGTPLPVIDRGVSRPVDVSDFIVNTFARVQGVGINFDGELNAVKGDSTYLFDNTLRLQGILQSRPSGGGLDFHPLNSGANSTPLRTRLAFVASSEAVIDVFDTYCYRRIATVPIRDPIIGPVRATVRPNGQLVLVGATIRGVTLVALPDNFTTSCQ